MEPYIQQIEALITENQTVKDQNRKLKRIVNQLLEEVKKLFSDLFPELNPFDDQSFDTTFTSIIPYYRKQILAMRLDIKTELSDIMTEFSCNANQQENQTLTYVWTDLISKFKFNMFKGKNSLKMQLDQQHQEINSLSAKVDQLETEKYHASIQLKKKDIIINEKAAEIQKYIGDIQMFSLEQKTLENSLVGIRNKYEDLHQQNISLHQDINDLQQKNKALRRQIKEKDDENGNK